MAHRPLDLPEIHVSLKPQPATDFTREQLNFLMLFSLDHTFVRHGDYRYAQITKRDGGRLLLAADAPIENWITNLQHAGLYQRRGPVKKR